MYLGVYKRKHDDIESTITFASLGPHFQKQIAAFALLCHWYPMEDIEAHHHITHEYEGEEEWDNMTKRQRDAATVRQIMLLQGWSMLTVPVEFVHFDEALYKALVDSECKIERKGRSGQVSLEPITLHQYY